MMNSSSTPSQKVDKILDLRGLKCPLPVLKTRAALDRMAAGEILEVTTTDPLAVLDIPNLTRQRGDALIESRPEREWMVFKIRKRD